MNSCYASIEQARHPELKGRPIAVCGSERDRNGIVLAKSPEAKKMGVKTGQVLWQARQACPGLIEVPADFSCYLEFSRLAHYIYLEYSPQVEPFGIDECWIDISGSEKNYGPAEKLAQRLRFRFKDELGISISVGISDNKIFAKLGSDYKKPDCQTLIDSTNYREIAWPLPVESLLFCGPRTRTKLNRYGIETIGDLALSEPFFIKKLLGINGLRLFEAANGRDSCPVAFYKYRPPVKSIGCGSTFNHDLVGLEEVAESLLRLSEEVEKRLSEKGFLAGAINLSVRDTYLISRNLSLGLDFPCQNAAEISERAMDIFVAMGSCHEPVRAMTIRAEKLVKASNYCQPSFLPDYLKHEKRERLSAAMVDLRRKYGPASCRFANIYNYRATNFDNNRVTMPVNSFVSLNEDRKKEALSV